ncbi:hypothetical protein H696_05282 [Fonticula alba]|uniref:COMM domain-containing protein n=1 Tax=Fonticula alba TaxID=691883 RepID=A0A058Z2K0_FONAL|nr:hypothetical protein H696_05282 [Fonticula alba]KCV68366.1 hypothetical protein H696_05282 [Fonticula alba]|eukprot:XP_009497420.1 hypothetical protein H696_05282 [Fonticula alba]
MSNSTSTNLMGPSLKSISWRTDAVTWSSQAALDGEGPTSPGGSNADLTTSFVQLAVLSPDASEATQHHTFELTRNGLAAHLLPAISDIEKALEFYSS